MEFIKNCLQNLKSMLEAKTVGDQIDMWQISVFLSPTGFVSLNIRAKNCHQHLGSVTNIAEAIQKYFLHKLEK